jgi:PemK-like, MazF-like toxin of type II toxin-antitoxin system
VISPATYNGKTGLMLCCPMTTQIKGYPFEVLIAGVRPGQHWPKWEQRSKILALIGKPCSESAMPVNQFGLGPEVYCN